MITLITATPGSGKTLYMIGQILEMIEKEPDRNIYTNINGLKVDNSGMPPNNFRETPHGSILIYDEAQKFDAFNKHTPPKNNSVGLDLCEHRHDGYDIFLITQSPKFLNEYALENVGRHIHLFRPANHKTITHYEWSYPVRNLTKSNFKDAESERRIRLNSDHFKLYDSAVLHTHKARMPQKLINTLITATIIFAVLGWFIYRGIAANSEKDEISPVESQTIEEPANTRLLSTQTEPINNPMTDPQEYELNRVSMVIKSSDGDCRAKNSYGQTLDIDPLKCMKMASDHRMFTQALETERPKNKTTQPREQIDSQPLL